VTRRLRVAVIGLSVVAVSGIVLVSLQARRHANELDAIGNLKTLSKAEDIFLNEDGRYGTIQELIQYRWIDNAFAAPRAGYTYFIVPDWNDYIATATPTSSAGGRYEYAVSADHIVRYSRNGPAPPGLAGLPVQ
jgi:hypothetical protein